MQYVLANNQLLQVVWVGLLEHTSFPDKLYVEAMFAQKRNFVLQFSAPGVVKPCLGYPKKCPTIPQKGDNLSPDHQTMSTQQATSALYTTFLLLWSGLCLLPTVTGNCTPHFQGSCGGFAVLLCLQANLAQVTLHHAPAACSSSSKQPLNARRPTLALVPAFLRSSRLSSCIRTTCLERLLTAVLSHNPDVAFFVRFFLSGRYSGDHCTYHSTCMLHATDAPHADIVMSCGFALQQS